MPYTPQDALHRGVRGSMLAQQKAGTSPQPGPRGHDAVKVVQRMFWAPMDLKLALASPVSLGKNVYMELERHSSSTTHLRGGRTGQSDKDGGRGGLSGLRKDWGN